MKTRRTHRMATLAALAMLPIGLLAACGDDDKPSETTTPGGTSTEIANPASTFCVEQGGTVEIVDEAGGQVGYCNLPDGTRVEEWEYFNSQTSTTGT